MKELEKRLNKNTAQKKKKTREYAEQLNVNRSTVVHRLQASGKIQNQRKWVLLYKQTGKNNWQC